MTVENVLVEAAKNLNTRDATIVVLTGVTVILVGSLLGPTIKDYLDPDRSAKARQEEAKARMMEAEAEIAEKNTKSST